MPNSTLAGTEPLSRAIANSTLMAGHRPVPLFATCYDIRIRGGLADVIATRTFRNDEATSLEATLTFPVPVHAVLYGLEARIGDRVVKALAQPRAQARATYEDAIDRGKTAVLHEELIKGVHLLSVGHIGPGMEIVITARFAVALAHIGGRIALRIPTTVGDVYGASGLPDCDELVHGGPVQMARITVSCDAGMPTLLGATLSEGGGSLPLDAPIDIEIAGWQPRELAGRAADGRGVTLRIGPAPDGDSTIDAAVVVDHSGSMASPCAGGGYGVTKHAAALLGLSESADALRADDRLHLWEFDDAVRDLGAVTAADWRSHIRKLSGPAGGTQIGRALDTVLASKTRDIILITDGKSHALEVQTLSRSGARFTVVLIGEDSLEANVGHLAALSGGDIFVPAGAGVADAVMCAIRFVRTRPGSSREAHLRRGGMAIRASWSPKPLALADDGSSRAIAAYAASLLLAASSETEACTLAVAEGLVTHLTSLVLVDEAGVAQTGLPAMRKVALPTPRTASNYYLMSRPPARVLSDPVRQSFSHGRQPGSVSVERNVRECRERAPAQAMRQLSETELVRRAAATEEARSSRPAAAAPRPVPARASQRQGLSLASVALAIPWEQHADQLTRGDLQTIDTGVAGQIRQAAGLARVAKIAKRLGLKPEQLVIGLLARSIGPANRHAARVDRALFGKIDHFDFTPLLQLLGLPVTARVVARS